MLIKPADDRRSDLDALEQLLTIPGLDFGTRARIEAELRRLQAGIQGEREAAYEIDFYYGAHPGRMVIHDLRLEVEGRVAQIDHLLVDRLMGIWVFESKHFSEGVGVDEYGDWVGFLNRRPYGIGSPIEQNRKHVAVLQDVFLKGLVELPRRLGVQLKPEIKSLVLVSKSARISRPKTTEARKRIDGLDTVVKVDQMKSLLDKYLDSIGVLTVAKIVSKERIEKLARDIAALHRPINTDWEARFGLERRAVTEHEPPAREPSVTGTSDSRCANCDKSVSNSVVAYCRDRREMFHDRVLCMDCQRGARRGLI